MQNTRKSSQGPTMSRDIVSEVNGDFGHWQLRTILLIFLCKIPTAWFTTCVIYTAPTPEKTSFHCNLNISSLKIAHGRSRTVASDAGTDAAQKSDRQFRFDTCNIYEERIKDFISSEHPQQMSNRTRGIYSKKTDVKVINVVPCEEFEFNSNYQSLVMQFNLVCSRQVLITVTQSFHGLGALAGGLVAVQMLKYVSPRCLMLWSMVFQIMSGMLTGWAPEFALHAFFRCLTSAWCALMYISGQVILNDITSGKAKVITITLFELFWSIGLILLPGISIFFTTWSHLYVAISAPLTILIILHRWIADSPRWLLRHNKRDEALKLLLESAAINHREIPLNLEYELVIYAQQLQTASQPNYWSIWDGQTKRKFIFMVHWAWAGAAVVYNVMILMIRSMGPQRIHVNTVSLGFAEMLGVFLGLYFILFTRRCWLWTGYVLLFAGVFTCFIWLVPQAIDENRRTAIEFIFWICLKLATSVSLAVLTTCSSELVTTEKRPILMLSVITFSRCFLPFGPFSSLLTTFHQHATITFFASISFINGILMCCINLKFWNFEKPRIQKVLTPRTYRRRLSSIPYLCEGVECKKAECYHNRRRVSINDIWEINCDIGKASKEDDEGGSTLSRKISNDKTLTETSHI